MIRNLTRSLARTAKQETRIFGRSRTLCGCPSSTKAEDSKLEKDTTKEDNNGNGGSLLEGTEGWKEARASYSEAIVKAERHGKDTIEEMQKKTVDHILKKHTRNETLQKECSNQSKEAH